METRKERALRSVGVFLLGLVAFYLAANALRAGDAGTCQPSAACRACSAANDCEFLPIPYTPDATPEVQP
jgi:hypothetical protein